MGIRVYREQSERKDLRRKPLVCNVVKILEGRPDIHQEVLYGTWFCAKFYASCKIFEIGTSDVTLGMEESHVRITAPNA